MDVARLLRARTLAVCVVPLMALLLGRPEAIAGQLLSPGPLAAAHAEVEGVRQCTRCHELGKRGVQPDRCLACHESLAARVAVGAGYHATVSGACADCHQDHLGRDFGLVRLDEDAFDHDAVGYPLRASHATVDCRSCHAADHVVDTRVRALKEGRDALDRTFLGLTEVCAGCHGSESPHGTQFGDRACAGCHDESAWTEVPGFDHGSTRYPLGGRHGDVACAACHRIGSGVAPTYRPLAFESCAGCHADPHAGAMGGACSGCHSTEGWGALANVDLAGRFDHARTSFALRGAHARADCAACHRRGSPPSDQLVRMAYRAGTAGHSYPRPRAEECASCHVDRHAFPDGAGRWTGCVSCHSEEAWAPSGFAVARHDAEATFPLEGAHAAVPCTVCHVGPAGGDERFVLAVDGGECASCHVGDSPHEGSYEGLSCETCHGTEAFDDVSFDHEAAAADRGLGACASCHAVEDPHGAQFAGRDCAACHGTDSFRIERFDHAGTGFPLDGAHERTACAACHVPDGNDPRAAVRYTPLSSDCADCHEGGP